MEKKVASTTFFQEKKVVEAGSTVIASGTRQVTQDNGNKAICSKPTLYQ